MLQKTIFLRLSYFSDSWIAPDVYIKLLLTNKLSIEQFISSKKASVNICNSSSGRLQWVRTSFCSSISTEEDIQACNKLHFQTNWIAVPSELEITSPTICWPGHEPFNELGPRYDLIKLIDLKRLLSVYNIYIYMNTLVIRSSFSYFKDFLRRYSEFRIHHRLEIKESY